MVKLKESFYVEQRKNGRDLSLIEDSLRIFLIKVNGFCLFSTSQKPIYFISQVDKIIPITELNSCVSAQTKSGKKKR